MWHDVYVRVRLQADNGKEASAVVRAALQQEELACEILSAHEIAPAPVGAAGQQER